MRVIKIITRNQYVIFIALFTNYFTLIQKPDKIKCQSIFTSIKEVPQNLNVNFFDL